MPRVFRRAPSPALVISLIALFVSLGGVSYGLATGSIDSREIKNRTIRNKDVRRNTLTGSRIRESRLGTVRRARTLRGVQTVQNQAAPVAGGGAGTPSQVEVACPAGHKAIGGGAAWIIPNFMDGNVATSLNAPITASYPVPATTGSDNHTGWRAHGRNIAGGTRALRVYAVCIDKVD